MPNGVTGHGATMTFGTTGLSFSLLTISGYEQTRGLVDDSHLGTTTNREYTPEDLASIGEFEVTFYFSPLDSAIMTGTTATAETITVTFPKENSGSTNPADIEGTGWISRWQSPDVATNEKMVGSLSVQWDGKTPPAFTVEA